MATRQFISRLLDSNACVRVGNTLNANVQKLIKDGETFDDKLSAALEQSNRLTGEIDLASKGVMHLVDRGADRSIGGLQRLLDGIIAALYETPLVSLSPDALVRLSQAQQLVALAFPEGTAFLIFEHEKQWEEMHNLEKALKSDEATALIADLGLKLEAEQALRWISLYGKHQGITEHHEDPTRKIEGLLVDWHNAYEKVAEKAKGAYDQDIPAESPKRALLLSPYLDELERLRSADRERAKEYRAKKKL